MWFVVSLLGMLAIVPVHFLSVEHRGLEQKYGPERRVSRTGLYGRMRHPQYLGATLSHLGVTLLLPSWFSLLVSPLVVTINYILCWKEETELVREFGHEYETCQREVPMFPPRFSG
ncbi:MAG: methyltransferase family protein [Candidatus Thorarchaeota archaeon]|nr:MAG: hypothetical protein DRP09_08595 [Candidatus Thorarchaeota archaeon]RLI59591.1 MAG: hypothetical protein DRO87_02415 [Candidatus Thorarchaeota archaeon]